MPTTLEEKEAAFRLSLDPSLSHAETEEAVTEYLRGLPENRGAEMEAAIGQLTVAIEALDKVEECAVYLRDNDLIDDASGASGLLSMRRMKLRETAKGVGG